MSSEGITINCRGELIYCPPFFVKMSNYLKTLKSTTIPIEKDLMGHPIFNLPPKKFKKILSKYQQIEGETMTEEDIEDFLELKTQSTTTFHFDFKSESKIGQDHINKIEKNINEAINNSKSYACIEIPSLSEDDYVKVINALHDHHFRVIPIIRFEFKIFLGYKCQYKFKKFIPSIIPNGHPFSINAFGLLNLNMKLAQDFHPSLYTPIEE
mmetsp:Transcript_12298/g.18358  ORF Transcript_12298/g.18358 Transcript_12298/m.18358 type:complete len:211 (+) Transcript_12298:71-703(+)